MSSAAEIPMPIITCHSTPSAHPAEDMFLALQRRLVGFEAATRRGDARTVVVVPSRMLDDPQELEAESRAYEERLLCLLLGLRDPALRMTYLTSSPVAADVLAAALALLPPRVRRDARRRLTMIAIGAPTGVPLSEALLARPALLTRIRATVADPLAAALVPYTTSGLERELAVALDIPLYGPDRAHARLGTKSGGRELFERAGVSHPAGAEGLHSLADLVEAITGLRAGRLDLSQVVLKLEAGVSGRGNAILDLSGLPKPGQTGEREAIRARLGALKPESSRLSATTFLAQFVRAGGIVEEWICGAELRSPSVQMQITPFGEVEVVSTHDQLLGGASGQSYLGCRFPAAPEYAAVICRLARRIGEELRRVGVVGRFAIDFVVVRDPRVGWRAYAIEVNLRRGGTTHPFETLAALTPGHYDDEMSAFITPLGERRHYVATDHLEAPELRALGRAGVLAVARRARLRFDPLRRTGVVFHMLTGVDGAGRCGFTAIADTAEAADALFARAEAELLAAARRATVRQQRWATVGAVHGAADAVAE